MGSSGSGTPEPTIDVRLSSSDLGSIILAEVTAGLQRAAPRLPLRHLDDSTTQQLWAQLEERSGAHPLQCMKELVAQHAEEIVAAHPAETLIMLGIAPEACVESILEAAERHGRLQRLVVVDQVGIAVEAACTRARMRRPGLAVQGVVADPIHHLDAMQVDGPCLLIVHPSLFSHLDGRERAAFFADLHQHLDHDDGLLLGVCLASDRGRLLAAFDDAEGLQATRSRNALRVLVRELDARIDPDGWDHVAHWDDRSAAVVVAVRAHGPQRVAIPKLHVERTFPDGTEIELERTSTFLRSGLDAQLGLAGLQVDRWWPTPAGDFALALASG